MTPSDWLGLDLFRGWRVLAVQLHLTAHDAFPGIKPEFRENLLFQETNSAITTQMVRAALATNHWIEPLDGSKLRADGGLLPSARPGLGLGSDAALIVLPRRQSQTPPRPTSIPCSMDCICSRFKSHSPRSAGSRIFSWLLHRSSLRFHQDGPFCSPQDDSGAAALWQESHKFPHN